MSANIARCYLHQYPVPHALFVEDRPVLRFLAAGLGLSDAERDEVLAWLNGDDPAVPLNDGQKIFGERISAFTVEGWRAQN